MTIVVSQRPGIGAPTPTLVRPNDLANRIHRIYTDRKNKQNKVLRAGQMIRQVYNGEWATVLPELETQERTQVANLVLNGIEQHALRISSTMPNIYFPPERNSKAARDRATDREMVIAGWHDANRMRTRIFRKRARYLVGYGSTPVYLRPGGSGDTPKLDHIPVWETWDPLATFPAPGDELVPSDCIYAFKRSWQWLNDHYNIAARIPIGDKSVDALLECLFYCDADILALVCIGHEDQDGHVPTALLQQVGNPAGRPLAIVPQRVTLDRLQGQFDQMVGMYEAQGYLWAMHLQALKRAIFTETWVEARPGEQAEVVAVADPIQGDIGVVNGGQVKAFRADPSIQTLQAIDRLEASERQTGAIPAELGGQSASNIRTGRRGSQILSSAIDYPIQEHQDILADSLYEENLAAIDIARTYWPSTEKTLYVRFGDGAVTYTPNDLFTTTTHSVEYAYSGTDQSGLVIEGLQRVGAGTLSDEGFMEIDPMISDPKFEMRRIQAEQLRKAIMSSVQQQAADPNGPYQPADLARLMTWVRDGNMEIEDAIARLHNELQKQQDQAQQGQLTGPAAQPGLSTPGAPGTPPGQMGQPAPEPGQQGLAALMSALRGTQRGAPAQPPPGVA